MRTFYAILNDAKEEPKRDQRNKLKSRNFTLPVFLEYSPKSLTNSSQFTSLSVLSTPSLDL